MGNSGQTGQKWDAVPREWRTGPTQFDFNQHDGLFTCPDGSGGTGDSLERYWEADTLWEFRRDQMTLLEGLEYSLPARQAYMYRSGHEGRVLAHNIRAIDNGSVGDLTNDQWEAILSGFGKRCAYCGCGGPMCLEHVTPICRDGDTTANNVVPACKSCNSKKHSRTPEEWLPSDKAKAFRAMQKRVLRKAFG